MQDVALAALIGGVSGALFARALGAFAHLEVPLSLTNMAGVLAYLLLVRGLGEQLAMWAGARALGARPAAGLALALAFALGLAADPGVHAYWAGHPHRPLVFVLTRVLLAVPWLVHPGRRALLAAGWRGGLLAILDRERGLATAVQALLLARVAFDAWRARAQC